MGRYVSPDQVIVMVVTLLLAAVLPIVGWILFSPRTPDLDIGTALPVTQALGMPSTETLEALSAPSIPIRQTAVSVKPPPGTSSPDAFAGAYIEMTADLDRSRSIITISVPAGIQGSYRAHLASGWGESDFACDVVQPGSKRLLCIGGRLPAGVRLDLILYQTSAEGLESAVFRASFVIPILPASATGPSGLPGGAHSPTFTRTAVPSDTLTPVPTTTDTAIPPTPTDTPTLSPTDTPIPPTSTDTEAPLPTNTSVPPTEPDTPTSPPPEPTDTESPPPTDTPAG